MHYKIVCHASIQFKTRFKREVHLRQLLKNCPQHYYLYTYTYTYIYIFIAYRPMFFNFCVIRVVFLEYYIVAQLKVLFQSFSRNKQHVSVGEMAPQVQTDMSNHSSNKLVVDNSSNYVILETVILTKVVLGFAFIINTRYVNVIKTFNTRVIN